MQKTIVLIIVWLGFDPSGQFIITLVAELGIQPLKRSFWTETSAITFSTFSFAVAVILRPPTVATGACVLLTLASLRFQRNAQDYEHREGLFSLEMPPRFTFGNFVFRSRSRYARQKSFLH